jgi:thiol-disulfide isomerase/thioredoxin
MKTTLVVTNKKNEQFHVEDKLCMVMVFANWCHFCKEVKGTYDELHQSHDEMLFFKINGSSDETSKSTEDELIQNFSKIVDDKIVFPSFYFFRNGVYVGKHTGENTMEGFNQSILSMKEPVFKMNGQIVEKSKSSSSGEEDDARIQRRAVRLVRKNQSLCLIFIKQIVNWNFFKDLFYWSVEKTMKIFSYKDCRKFFPKQLCSFVTILMSCYFFWIFLNLIYISKFMRSSGSSRMLTIFSTYLKQTQVIITEFVMLSVQDVTDASYSKKAKMMLSI